MSPARRDEAGSTAQHRAEPDGNGRPVRAETGREIYQLERERDDLSPSGQQRPGSRSKSGIAESRRREAAHQARLESVNRRISESEAHPAMRRREGGRPAGHRHPLHDGRRRDGRRRHVAGEGRRQGAHRAAHGDDRSAEGVGEVVEATISGCRRVRQHDARAPATEEYAAPRRPSRRLQRRPARTARMRDTRRILASWKSSTRTPTPSCTSRTPTSCSSRPFCRRSAPTSA